MGAVDLLRMQLGGRDRGDQVLQDFARKSRFDTLAYRMHQENVDSPDRFRDFIVRNQVRPEEAQGLMQMIQARNSTFPGPPPPPAPKGYSSSPLGIYSQDTGDVVHPAPSPPTPAEKYDKTDWYRRGKDGSIETRTANSGAEASLFEQQGFVRGKFRAEPEGSSGGAEGNVIKTWILPSGKLFHAPSNVPPPSGARPWSDASSLEHRMLVGQELVSIRSEKRQARRELDQIQSLPEIEFYKPQKARIPSLKSELEDLNYREQELLGKGNDFSPRAPSPESSASGVPTLGGFNASDHAGRVLVNPDTGERMKSDGKVWAPVEEEK